LPKNTIRPGSNAGVGIFLGFSEDGAEAGSWLFLFCSEGGAEGTTKGVEGDGDGEAATSVFLISLFLCFAPPPKSPGRSKRRIAQSVTNPSSMGTTSWLYVLTITASHGSLSIN
jgi:hypothetical protein